MSSSCKGDMNVCPYTEVYVSECMLQNTSPLSTDQWSGNMELAKGEKSAEQGRTTSYL